MVITIGKEIKSEHEADPAAAGAMIAAEVVAVGIVTTGEVEAGKIADIGEELGGIA
jgi:hypothetical protein